MAYSTVTATTGAVIPAADINKLMENIDLVKGGTAGVAPTTTVENLSSNKMAKITPADGKLLQSDENGTAEATTIDSANVTTASAVFATGEIILGAGADRTLEKSGKSFDTDIITNDNTKVPNSAFFYKREGGAGSVASYYKEFIDNTDRSQATPANNTWYNLGSASITLEEGLWWVEFSATLYAAASTAVDLHVMMNTTNATPTSEQVAYFAANTAVAFSTLNKRFKLSIGVGGATYNLYVKTFAVGTISGLILANSTSACTIYAHRIK